MYIFSYFFQKGHFQGSSKKGHIDKKLWGADDPSVSRVNAELKISLYLRFHRILNSKNSRVIYPWSLYFS